LFETRPPNKINGKAINGAIDYATISSSKVADMKYPIEAAVRQTNKRTT
jgi:hypothetical protein